MRDTISGLRQQIKRLQEDVFDMHNSAHQFREENRRLRTELWDLEATFALQQKRMRKATKLWRKAHNKPNVLPDLGDLLEWLMEGKR